jgi:hypothetical protein
MSLDRSKQNVESLVRSDPTRALSVDANTPEVASYKTLKYLKELDGVADIKDARYKALAENETKFFKLALDILEKKPELELILRESGVDAALALSHILKARAKERETELYIDEKIDESIKTGQEKRKTIWKGVQVP